MDWDRPGGVDAQLVDNLRAGATEPDPADPARLDDNDQRHQLERAVDRGGGHPAAQHGCQLGRMADALQALIEDRGQGAPDDDRFKQFTRMKQEIDEIKLDAAATRVDRLRDDLAALKAARPTEYRRLRDALQRMLDQ
jgi:hypothetical protein